MIDIPDLKIQSDDEMFWYQLFETPNFELKGNSYPAAPNRPGGFPPETESRLPIQFRDLTLPEIVMEFHMTIRPKRRLTPKGASLLLTCQVVENSFKGCDLIGYLTLNFLLEVNRNYLKGINVNKDATKKAIALAEAYLLAINPTEWFSLTDRRELSAKQLEILSSITWFPDTDVFNSWSAHYQYERFLEVRIVPIEQIQNHQRDSIPYSGYTKGYHESGKGYSRDGMVYGVGKTPYSPEIDEDRTFVPEDLESSSQIDSDPEYRALSLAIQRAKEGNRKRQ
jgi:hypothetical protein